MGAWLGSRGAALMLVLAAACAAAPVPLAPSPPPEHAAAPVAEPAAQDAQRVTVEGRAALGRGGVAAARDAAIRDAMRRAVEQVVGTLIDSRTLTENFVTVRDRIYAASDGYVSRYAW